MGLSAEQFLEHVCLKAELPPTAWRDDDTVLWTFEGHAIRAPLGEFISLPRERGAALPVAAQELPALAEYCRGNLAAFLSGATPSYFAFGLPDGNVNGLIVSLLDTEGRELVQANRLSFKESLPLQSTLFSMTEGLARRRADRFSPDQVRQTWRSSSACCGRWPNPICAASIHAASGRRHRAQRRRIFDASKPWNRWLFSRT
jgi:hypothetical protein